MKKLQAVVGYTAASLAPLLVLAVILLLVGGGLDKMIDAVTGLTLAPSISGGTRSDADHPSRRVRGAGSPHGLRRPDRAAP